MHINKISSYLLVLTLTLLLSVFCMSFLTHYIYKSLQYDAYFINHTGIVRGSIQRYSKLRLAGCENICEELENKIDREILEIKEIYVENSGSIINELNDRLLLLTNKWTLLKDSGRNLNTEIREIREINKQDFLNLSELCWEIADSIVLLTEVSSYNKLKNIKIYYFILAATIISILLIIGFIYQSVRNKLGKEASTDHLTGLNNLRTFNMSLDRELDRCERYSRVFSLLLFDIDDFKSINDSSGHKVGDEALVELSGVVRKSVRTTDSVYRIGGDEFAIIASEIGEEGARELAEKIRNNIHDNNFFLIRNITISLGIGVYKNSMTKSELMVAADKSMYWAKNHGKNMTGQLVD